MALADGPKACPALYEKGILSLDFNPGFLHVDAYDDGTGETRDGLTISSFHNAFVRPGQTPPVGFFERDLVARIENIDGALACGDFDPATDVEILTDLAPGMPKTVWPNDAVRAPDGVFPFEAVVVPQGFHPAPFPGRLTAINLDDAQRTEYVIDQSTQNGWTPTGPFDPTNAPRFYHRALFLDMDGDELLDIVSVRSGFRVGPGVYPPFSELVYFKNPGAALSPTTEWQEVVLYGGPAAGFLGPDVHLEAHDFEGDGVPEIVATHFFSASNQTPPTAGKISLYGAPVGGTWADVNALAFALPRVKDLSSDQGFPFDVQVVDLDLDGRADILATNHQPDNCTPPTSSAVPGRVYALSQPADGDIFGSDWTTHILLDDIRPNPSTQPISPPGRLAPGRAQAFHPKRAHEGKQKPWIVVGGDEASKVWVLRPRHPGRRGNFEYKASVIFDINEHYGPNTTQTPMLNPFGITISTIGGIAVRYDGEGPSARAELYVPVFEAKDIHVFTFRKGPRHARVSCDESAPLSCQ
jgi:hypothetical protein